MLHIVLFAELVYHLQHLLILYLSLIHVYAFHIFAEFNRTVNLDLLVCCSAIRTHLLCLRCLKGCLELIVV